MNRWGIPGRLEEEITRRDAACIYCGIQMVDRCPPGGSRRAVATWEHIINDARIVTRENIARCCAACNSSRETKKLADWLQSDYCKRRGINEDSVAEVVRKALKPWKDGSAHAVPGYASHVRQS